MTERRWTASPSATDIPGNASASFLFTRKNPKQGSWLDDGGIPSNKTGIPFGLLNGELQSIWVGSSDLRQYDIEVWHHEGNLVNAMLLTTVTVLNTNRISPFSALDYGLVLIPVNVQLASRLVNVVGSAPNNLKVYLGPVGDIPQ